ncbi:hypothetical protein NP493_592g01026 [Ridgeia piscesae]|uniref:Uncharacterized protein n=1 Tax=Ridgeia piscesae TaxID=27915 RepID=A0AAD9NS48_RIDPI|nr:hypothetical protein NP493_592g01026 [Ridgeia piscesae]
MQHCYIVIYTTLLQYETTLLQTNMQHCYIVIYTTLLQYETTLLQTCNTAT